MKFTVMLETQIEVHGDTMHPQWQKFYAMLAQYYAESAINRASHGPIQINGITFQPKSMTARAQGCDYFGKAPDLNDAVAAHRELADAAVSGPGVEAWSAEALAWYVATRP